MTASLAIALILVTDLALIAGVAYVMSRAKNLTAHVSADRAQTPTAVPAGTRIAPRMPAARGRATARSLVAAR